MIIPKCISLILVAQNALVPQQIDEITRNRVSNQILSDFNVPVDNNNSMECEDSIDYYYTSSKVVFTADNKILSGRQEMFIEDILDGKIQSFKANNGRSLEESNEISIEQLMESNKKINENQKSNTAVWVVGALGVVATGLLIGHLSKNKKSDAPAIPSSQPSRKGPRPSSTNK